MPPYVAGRNAVLETIRASRRARRLLVDESARASDEELRTLVAAARAAGLPVERVPRARLDAIHPRHQGVAVDVVEFAYRPWADLVEAARAEGERALVLVLDEMQDPQNLGSLLRTALAVGATGVVIPERRSATVTPAVVRSSAGAVEHLAISQIPNLGRALGELKRVGLWVVGLDMDGGLPYDDADLRGPLALVVGSEGHGLRRMTRERCDLTIHIPMLGPTESLNAAVAGSIALYQILHARK
jgi:23S rRNA (guanosine2251-2'-O)-methyltransferase